MPLIIKILPAYNGDSIHISYGEKDEMTNILVDGGIARTYPQFLQQYLKVIKARKQFIDLLIVTHYDSDHIGGINRLFDDIDIYRDGFIKKVWFNSGKLIIRDMKRKKGKINHEPIELNDKEISLREGICLAGKLKSLNCWGKDTIKAGFIFPLKDVKIEVISPFRNSLKKINKKWQIEEDKQKNISASGNDYDVPIDELIKRKFDKDTNIFNESSIAFILHYKNRRILMSGDASPSRTTDYFIKNKKISSSNRLKLDLVKVSHHGSKRNTSPDFLKFIDCSHFIISTDGNTHGHPAKECLARIINSQKPGVTFYFNYENENTTNIFTKEELFAYNISINYLNRNNYQIELV